MGHDVSDTFRSALPVVWVDVIPDLRKMNQIVVRGMDSLIVMGVAVLIREHPVGVPLTVDGLVRRAHPDERTDIIRALHTLEKLGALYRP
ncbi:hypothetical protein [Streptomyces sp. CC208A]|uniref:hypothetical protein n=1 Tax=Streptomyces sp. CC208A TaxID=3044573 RepID=UPI0024A9851F|nr:hypothetical protein [Streptomyces sp. CC208A]